MHQFPNPAASCTVTSSALCWQPLFSPPLIQTQCLQVCLSNVIHWSGIPSIPAAVLSDNIIYTLHCHAMTLIHWLSSLIHCRVCSFTFQCALSQHMCTNLLHSSPITELCWNALVAFIFHTPYLRIPITHKILPLAVSATQHSSSKHP